MSAVFNPTLVLLLLSFSVSAQSVFDAFYGPEVNRAVAVTLTLPLDSIAARSPNEQAGQLTFADHSGAVRTFGVDVSIRGKFRQTKCGFPPLKLDFDKSELRASGLAKHDKYKLVAACYADSSAQILILKEYLAYRAYALLSPEAHFRTQLLRITYRDAAAAQAERTEYAFLIEDPDEMAERAGGEESDDMLGLTPNRYAPTAEATHALAQYLLGNGDWSLTLQRNVKIVTLPNQQLVPVGYDFDFSGWVGAPYASPSRDQGQQSIYERVYLGYQQSDRTLNEVNQAFRSRRRDLLRLIADFDLIDKQERTVLQRFVQRFFDEVGAMSTNTEQEFYRQLRGQTASVIPPGARPSFYGSSAR
ncbi:hypothetical protein LEM8419_00957 [Neolewinella maritima]|uniref:Uncharacterized protein n=1 Tax=Neolewinella maritima TaxID=1383882 RepID=A0ABM9AZA4_9BACT|nr:hypothetical protein [Neolewinella maritima]CAH0999657.1 hypothetical protein LEM8419_00957 [Neolewinella maritima]